MFQPERAIYREMRLDALERLLARYSRNVSQEDLCLVLPARGPSGCKQNRERARVARLLNKHGFSFRGKRIKVRGE